jgi:hypothetical protein
MLAGATLVPVASAQAFTSNNFVSPTGNIHCAYTRSAIGCQTMNDGFIVAVGRYGRAVHSRISRTLPWGPTLTYGASYSGGGAFRCISTVNGMTCTSLLSGHGFFINRTRYRTF